MVMEKFLYPPHSAWVFIRGPSNVGQSLFLTNYILNLINEYNKIYICSPSRHHAFYQKLFKCFSNCIPVHIIPNILNEEDIGIVIEENINNKDFEKTIFEIKTHQSIEELKYPQGYDGGIIILDDLNEKEMNDPRVQAMFKSSRLSNLSIII